LPGMKAVDPPGSHGSDTAAILVWDVPVSFVESRVLLEHGELPLWNRYSHCGDTLIGQAVSMLGDPLHLIVLFGHGTSGAWDIKFLAAKFLFCVGFGLVVLRLLGSRPLSLVFSALAAYCGAFFFINNHPAFFVFIYAPWVLFLALVFLDLKTRRYLVAGWAWLLADFACFNAGHVEVSVVLIAGMNLVAIVYAWSCGKGVGDCLKVTGRMAVGTFLFLGLTAPMWMAFLGALDNAYSAHSKIHIGQLHVTSLVGVFDDLFYLHLLRDQNAASAYAPGSSLLIMTGSLLAFLRWRQLKHERFFWINSAAILLWGGCVFGWVPPQLLGKIPFLNRVGHGFTDFSYLTIIHLMIQAAYGFKCLVDEKDLRRTVKDLLWVVAIFAGLVSAYAFLMTHHELLKGYLLCTAAGAIGAPLVYVFLKNRPEGISFIGWTSIVLLAFVPHFRFGLYHHGNTGLLMVPGPRVALNGPSPAIDKVKADKSGPFRIIGVPWIFYGDYFAAYELEDIRSCAPLSNNDFIELVQKFPGMTLEGTWVIEATDPVKAQPLLNLLNVKYLLAAPALTIQEGLAFHLVDRLDMGIAENLDVWPRAFFTDRIVSLSSNVDFINHLIDNSRQPFVALTPAELAREPSLSRLVATNQGVVVPATGYQLLPNSTAFDVHVPSAGIVCLTETQAKDFTATANGEPKDILTVNRAFKGVYFDRPGDYHLEFVYRPHHWRLACRLFFGALAGALVLSAWVFLRGRREKSGTIGPA